MDQPALCPLCHDPRSQRQPCNESYTWAYSCPRCGDYYISELLYNKRFIKGQADFFLACVAFEWHLRHKATFDLDTKFILTDDGLLPYSPYEALPDCHVFSPDEMLDAFPRGIDIIERGMLNLARMVRHPVEKIPWDMERLPYALFTTAEQVDQTAKDLQELGYIHILPGTSSEAGIRIKPRGWEQIGKWKEDAPTATKQAFVAMWFAQEMDAFYRDAIKPAIESAGFDCKRIDSVEHNNKICDEIVAEIRKSRFIVADFTGQRCGVYFEAGFGMGMGLPVIWLVRKDDVDKLHFDTRQYNHIVYDSADDLKAKLYNRIAATIH